MTHTTKHTPGPWVVNTFIVNGQHKLEVLDATGANACVQANAHLIAAAPVMYIELKALYEYCLHNIPDMSEYSGDPEQAMRMKAARAALAQAEGKQ